MSELLELADLPNGTMSPSSYSMFKRCPRQYHYRYVEGIKSPPQSSQILGLSAHDGLQGHFAEHIEKGKHPKTSKLLERFENALPAQIDTWQKTTGQEVRYKKGQTKDTLLDDGTKALAYYDQDYGIKLEPASVEKPYGVEIKDVKWKLEGRVDLIPEDMAIVDWKTTRASFGEYSAFYSEQLILGQLGLEANEIVTKERILHVIVLLKRAPKVQVIKANQASIQERNETMKELLEVALNIRAGLFWRTDRIKETCSWCGYRPLCRPDYDRFMADKEKNDETE